MEWPCTLKKFKGASVPPLTERENFPAMELELVRKWQALMVGRSQMDNILYFMAMASKDFCLNLEELKILHKVTEKDLGVNLKWIKSYRLDKQRKDVYRRLGLKEIGANEVLKIKRDMERLQMPNDPLIDFMFLEVIGNGKPDKMGSFILSKRREMLPLQMITSKSKIPVLNKEENQLAPKENKMLCSYYNPSMRLPVKEWLKIVEWAINCKVESGGIRGPVISVMMKLSTVFKGLCLKTVNEDRFEFHQRTVWQRAFPAQKQMLECLRRFRTDRVTIKWSEVKQLKERCNKIGVLCNLIDFVIAKYGNIVQDGTDPLLNVVQLKTDFMSSNSSESQHVIFLLKNAMIGYTNQIIKKIKLCNINTDDETDDDEEEQVQEEKKEQEDEFQDCQCCLNANCTNCGV